MYSKREVVMNSNERLRNIRNKTGLSQARFSEKFRIPVRTYEQWEAGSRKPPDYVIWMIERLIEIEREEK